jgi:hypothetical protein
MFRSRPMCPQTKSLGCYVPPMFQDQSVGDALFMGRIVYWTPRPRVTSFRGRVVQGTEHPRLFIWGRTSRGQNNISLTEEVGGATTIG